MQSFANNDYIYILNTTIINITKTIHERQFFMRLYIDPGTGSMLFTVLIGLLSTLIFFGKKAIVKLSFILHGGHVKRTEEDKKKIPYLIFSDHKRYWNVFESICKEFDKRGIDVAYWTMSEDDPALTANIPHLHAQFIGAGNKAFAKLNMLNAEIILSTTPGLNVLQWKRSRNGGFYIHVSHACNDVNMYRMFGLDYYDSVLVSGPYLIDEIRELEDLRHLPRKEVRIAGITYMDALKERLEKTPAPVSDKKTVLLSPSWGKSSILYRFGTDIIDALIATGYRIIVRPHPQSYTDAKELMDSLFAKYPETDDFIWDRSNDNFDAMNRADIMISDFSGIMFDYALVFDKPLIYTDTDYDKSPYDCWWSKKPLWTFETLPKIGHLLTPSDFSRMKEVIDETLADTTMAAAREVARQETWTPIGSAAVNTVEYAIQKRTSLLIGKRSEKQKSPLPAIES